MTRPRTSFTLLTPSSFLVATLPSTIIKAGLISSICSKRWSEVHVSPSRFLGGRLFSGRHLTVLVIKRSLRSTPLPASTSSKKRPAAPTNGWPLRSSSRPGASPMSITRADGAPSPGTALVRVVCNGHCTQLRICVASASSLSISCKRGMSLSLLRRHRNLYQTKRRAGGIRLVEQRHCDIVDRNPPCRLAFWRPVVSMAMKDGSHGIAIQWFLEPARAEKGKNLRRLSHDGVPNRQIVKQKNALRPPQFRQGRL